MTDISIRVLPNSFVDRVTDDLKAGKSSFMMITPSGVKQGETFNANTQRVLVFSIAGIDGNPLPVARPNLGSSTSHLGDGGQFKFTATDTTYELVTTSAITSPFPYFILIKWGWPAGSPSNSLLLLTQIKGFNVVLEQGTNSYVAPAQGPASSDISLAACAYNAASSALCGRRR